MAILTTVVAVVLSILFSSWEGQSKLNEAIFNKRAILSSITDFLDEDPKAMAKAEVLRIFDKDMKQIALNMEGEILSKEQIIEAGYKGGRAEDIDMKKEKKKDEAERIFPLYVYSSQKDGKVYIVSVRGNGLWDEIWGNIALKSDFSTVVGANFDHKGETPGLGAEIKDNPAFPAAFKGKTFMNADGEYIGVDVVKNGSKGSPHKIDGISGATVTGVGVAEMLIRGVKYYQPYFNTIKTSQGKKMGMLNNK